MKQLYPAVANSPETVIMGMLAPDTTTVTVQDISKIPDAPNLLVLGAERPDSETVLLTAINGETLHIERGIDGTTARSWADRTTIARNFTAYDHNAMCEHVDELETLSTVPAGEKPVSFVPADSRSNLFTGEAIKVSFGKLAKWFTDLKAIAWTGSYADLSNKPKTFTPSAHTHDDLYYTEAEIDSAMSTKANVESTNISAEQDLFALASGKYIFEGIIPAGKNYPTNLVGNYYYIIILIEGRSIYGAKGYGVITIMENSGCKWINLSAWDHWIGWKRLATAEPPQEFDLPLANNIITGALSTKNTYCRNQEGFVTVSFYVKRQDNGAFPIGRFVIATTPVGYRTAYTVHTSGFGSPSMEGTSFTSSLILAAKDGTICFYNSKENIKFLTGVIQYYAI